MKRSRAITLTAVILLALAYAAAALLPRGINYKYENPFLSDGTPYIIAHRGGGGEFPENTLEAFYNAYSASERVIMETDVHITRDGVAVLLHDDRIDGTSNRTGYIGDWNYTDLIAERVDFGYDNATEDGVLSGELTRFRDAEGNERRPTDLGTGAIAGRDAEVFLITTLEELVTAFPDSLISVEIKESGEAGRAALREVLRIIDEHDAYRRVLVASFHEDINGQIKRMIRTGELPDSFMYTPSLTGSVGYLALYFFGLDALYTAPSAAMHLTTEQFGIYLATDRLASALHARGIAAHFFTVNSESEMLRLLDISPDGIMTDYPHTLAQLIEAEKTE